jgi:hypothetical protein
VTIVCGVTHPFARNEVRRLGDISGALVVVCSEDSSLAELLIDSERGYAYAARDNVCASVCAMSAGAIVGVALSLPLLVLSAYCVARPTGGEKRLPLSRGPAFVSSMP